MPEATLLAWKDAWSIGVPEIDREHAVLVADFARLIDPAHRDDHEYQRAALDALTGHVCRHFDHEEHLMRVHGYPDLRRHAEVHAMLLKQLNHFETLLNAQP
jgi:hemerythrin